ncbi:MAG: translation elongation factor-like protein [Nitrososphaeria archaeon]
MSEIKKSLVGKVTHFYPKIGVAVVALTSQLKVGDRIVIEGKVSSFEQVVESMQIEHVNIQKAESGQSIGMKVVKNVKEGDLVYKIE